MGKGRRNAAKRGESHRPARDPVIQPGIGFLTRVRAAIIGVLPIIAIFLTARVALAEAYRIPSGSMEPTLQVGDWLFVNKLRFGPHIPFTSSSLPGYATPRREDVVVFVSPPQVPAIRITPNDI